VASSTNQWQKRATEPDQFVQKPGMGGQTRKSAKGKSLPSVRVLRHRIAPVVKKVMMQINLNRASLGTCAAQRGCIGEMFPIHQAAQVRRDNRTDGSLIGGPVGVATDVPKDRAGV